MDDDLSKRITELERIVYTHKHLGTDLTQKIGATSVFGGSVDPNATAASTVPNSWTVSVSGGHVYTVTHNLNRAVTTYEVICQPINSNATTHFVVVPTKGVNSFTVEFDTSGLVAGTTDWIFILVLT